MTAWQLTWRAGRFSLRFRSIPLATNLLLAAGILLMTLLALAVGSSSIGLETITAWLRLDSISPTDSVILSHLRAPRVVLALMVGAMLALAGCLTQHMTRNDLADPSLIGVRAGAALCIVAMIVNWPDAPFALRPLFGLSGGLAVGGILNLLSRGASPLKFVMLGFGLSWCLSSCLIILLTMADIRGLQQAMVWLSGSLESANWRTLDIAAAILAICWAAVIAFGRHIELEDVGPAMVATLGASRRVARLACLFAATLLVAGAVSVAGGVGFVGLIAPHVARLLPWQGLRGRLVSSSLIGALLVLSADVAARTLFSPVNLPVGVPLAAIGAPLLVFLLCVRRSRIQRA